jgi:hypothetical protein
MEDILLTGGRSKSHVGMLMRAGHDCKTRKGVEKERKRREKQKGGKGEY